MSGRGRQTDREQGRGRGGSTEPKTLDFVIWYETATIWINFSIDTPGVTEDWVYP